MAMVNVNIRMDEVLKNQFEEFCKNVGMTMTTAVNVFAKETVNERQIPFIIKDNVDPFYSEENQKWIQKSIKQVEDGKIISKTIDELEQIVNG